MISVSLYRILRHAFRNFQRNVWLSLATTLVMTLTLIMMSFLYFVNVLGAEVLRNIEQKVDLSATFKQDVSEQEIQQVATSLENRADVEEVRIVSSEEALDRFRERHADDPFIEESLRELEENPLRASVFIVATQPRLYENIAQALNASDQYTPFLDEVNFQNSKEVIDRLVTLMGSVRNIGLITTGVFAILVLLIMFNTIRLAIYSYREEIDIMHLVGASNWFIQGPFLFEAMFVALISVAISSLVVYPVLNTAAPHIQQFFFSSQGQPFDIYQYALDNWMTVIGLQAGVAVVLAIISSYTAIRRYLR